MSKADFTFVQVPVPSHLVVDVYSLIAEKISYRPVESATPNVGMGIPEEWSAFEIRRMYRESDTNMRAILDALAARAGEELSSRELKSVLSRSRGETATSSKLGGTLGAFGRRIKSRYRKQTWPFAARWIPQTNENEYTMSKEVAALLKGDSGIH